ncbi:MAG TPA: peptidylprolyl isomerase [Nocardioides sp.]|nr:peptidylprolyl isomerase [Nocardioides sp.]
MSHRLLMLPPAVLLAALLSSCGADEGSADQTAVDSPSATESTPTGPTSECTYSEGGSPAKDVSTPPSVAPASGEVPATISTSVGDLAATLDVEAAPCTVNSFASLAEQGYFDDTPCHRLTTAGIFVLQCGDPSGTGGGGPGYSFADELTGQERYPAGTLAMANAGPDTNGSQFFIVYEKTRLPPLYTVFGSVDDAAVEAVREVAQAGTDDANGPGDGAPRTPVTIESVTAG